VCDICEEDWEKMKLKRNHKDGISVRKEKHNLYEAVFGPTPGLKGDLFLIHQLWNTLPLPKTHTLNQ